MLVNKIMQVLKNLFGLNKKINASDVAVKDLNNKAKILNDCVIVDSGTNSNGSWIKYGNGIMICWKNKGFGKINISNRWGTMYDSEKLQLGDFPQPFVGDYPSIFIMPWLSFLVERNYSPSLTSFGAFWAARPDSATVDIWVSCFAIGRWKE